MDDRLLALKMASWLEANLRDQTAGAELEKASGYSDNRLRQKFFSVTGELWNIENELRAWLDAGKVAMMEFLEFQLVLGYDERGLVLPKSWGDDCGGTEKKAVSFGNWAECLDREGWVYFTLLEKEELRADERSLLRAALDTALRIRTAPEDFRQAEYAVGDAAWEAWLSCIDRGFGSQHGNRWNGMVWAECRAMASAFFTETRAMFADERAASLCSALAEIYRACAEEIRTAKDKDATAAWQRAVLGYPSFARA